MSRTPIDRLNDGISFAAAAQGNAAGLSGEELADAGQPLHAALYDLAVLGEALSRIPEEIQTLAPTVPWDSARRLRNRIIHAYWDIDLTIVADVIEKELDPLKGALRDLIALLQSAEA